MKQLEILMVFVIGMGVFIAGCTTYPGHGNLFLSQTEDGQPPFSKLWEIAVSASGIDNRTAELGNLMVLMDGNNSINTLLMDFTGMKQGSKQVCAVDVSPSGRVGVRCMDGPGQIALPAGTHPLAVLSTLELFPYRSLDPSMDGIHIWTGEICCDLMFDNTSADLFELRNGTFIPVETIVFHQSEEYLYPVHICRIRPPERVITYPEGRVEAISPESHPKDHHCLILFTSEDVARAVTVVYPPGVATSDLRDNRSIMPEPPAINPGGAGGGGGGGIAHS
jgi:hypothetical protein